MLVVENLNMMFRDMAEPDAGWRLRKILQTEPRIILLASATSRFDEIDHPDHALYDLFRILLLRNPLNTNECAVLWEAVAGKCPPSETIRSLEILTGGSPRLIAIVARFDARGVPFPNSWPNYSTSLMTIRSTLRAISNHSQRRSGGCISCSPICGSQRLRGRSRSALGWRRASAVPNSSRLIERGVVQVIGRYRLAQTVLPDRASLQHLLLAAAHSRPGFPDSGPHPIYGVVLLWD